MPLTRDEDEGIGRSYEDRDSWYGNALRRALLALLCRIGDVGTERWTAADLASAEKFVGASSPDDDKEMADMRRESVLLSLSKPEWMNKKSKLCKAP